MTELVARCPVHHVAHSTATECWKCLMEKPKSVLPVDAEPIGDARAQLWARVYAAHFEVCMHRPDMHETGARWDARMVADAAVRDFDEHYLGGRR